MTDTAPQVNKVVTVTNKDKVIVRTPGVNKVVAVASKENVLIRTPGIAGPKGDPGTQFLTGQGVPSNLMGKVGDFYIDTVTRNTYGPKSNAGWPTTPVFTGFDRALLGKTVDIAQASETWTVIHGLGYNPNATALTSSGDVVEGNVSYPDENTIVLTFTGAISGKVYLS